MPPALVRFLGDSAHSEGKVVSFQPLRGKRLASRRAAEWSCQEVAAGATTISIFFARNA
jgi:hypothetical protein